MIDFFARHPTAANLLMLVLVAAGLLNLRGLRRETFPDAAPTEVQITVVYPGATAREVEETIVQRLEDALDGVQHVKEVRSEARQNLATVTLEMTESGSYVAFRNEIDNAINSIDDFPDDVEQPIVKRLNTKDLVMSIVVSGPMSPVDLKAYCEDLKNRLQALPEISSIEISGFSDHLLRVEMSQEALLRYGLSPVMVAEAIAAQSVDLPAGTIESSEDNLLVRVSEQRESAKALEDLIVTAAPGGAEIRIGDIAVVRDEFELEEDRLSVAGQRGARLQIMKAKTEDSIRVAEAVKDFLDQERQRNPQVTLTITRDVSVLVQDRLSLLLRNGLQGIVLVFAAMWSFFNARLSFWVVISLPVSFLGAFALAPHVGLTINMLTMVGLLMALGLLMDDGIVIAENIARRREEGEPAMKAAVEGVKEVAGGVISSFITTCSILGPLMFLSGDIGRVLKVLPMMLLLVLAVSLVEAFLILPAHLGHSLEHHDPNKRSRLRRVLDRTIEAARQATGAAVDWTIRWRYLTAGVVVMLFLATVGLMVGGLVRFQVFPDLEGDTLVARVLMPPGTPLWRTEAMTDRLTEGLEATNAELAPDQPDGQDLIETVFVRFNENADALEAGTHVATVTAELLAAEERNARLDNVIRSWKSHTSGLDEAVSITFDEPAIGPGGRALEIQLSGPDLDDLDLAAQEIKQFLRPFDGVYNVSDDLRRGQREIVVRLRPGTTGLDINAASIGRQLRGSFQGLVGDEVQVGEESYDVEVRLADADRDSLNDLEEFLVTLPSGDVVPLGDVATLDTDRGWSRIARFNGQRVATVFGSVDSQRSNAIAVLGELQLQKLPELKAKFPDIDVTFKGQSEAGVETGSSIGRAALIGCLGVFVLLSFQFRSYLEPLIVMVAIPFAFVGVVWGHLAFGMSLSLPSVMGYASLAGVVVNDSILLMLFLKAERAAGRPAAEAAGEASRIRFRAVMITSLTTIVGLLPLLFERSLQAQVLIPIAISICCGLLASTLLVLLVLPPLYVILADMKATELSAEPEVEPLAVPA